jgi:hypothetical protein
MHHRLNHLKAVCLNGYRICLWLMQSMVSAQHTPYAPKLEAAEINSLEALLQKGSSKKGRKELEDATGISGKLLLRWINTADLFRVKGIGEQYSDLLEVAGVDTKLES